MEPLELTPQIVPSAPTETWLNAPGSCCSGPIGQWFTRLVDVNRAKTSCQIVAGSGLVRARTGAESGLAEDCVVPDL